LEEVLDYVKFLHKNSTVMAEKIFVTNYDRGEIIMMMREAFSEELKAVVEEQNKKKDWDVLLTRKEVAEMLKVSLVTISKYQKQGRLTFYRIGRHVYFKKGDIMQALEDHMKYKHRRFNF